MEVKELIEYIVRRSNITESELLRLVAEKKKRIGAGYLTDQGALFLIAADLGIDIDKPQLELSIKDIYAGLRDLTLIARVLKIYPLRKITREDGSTTLLRRLVIYDNDAKVRLTLWDNLALIPDNLGLRIGNAIRINKVYTRSSPDGKIDLNTNVKSMIEVIKDELPHIRPIDRLAVSLEDINEEGDNLVIDTIVSQVPRMSTFTNSKGDNSKILHMQVSNGKSMRIVIWNVEENNIPKIIKRGDNIRLIGFKAKRDQFGEIELHGDEGSVIELKDSNRYDLDTIQLRVISITNRDNVLLALSVDKESNTYILTINEDIVSNKIKDDTLIECIPSRIYGNNIILGEDSYIRVLDEDLDIPIPSKLEVKINDIKADDERIYFLEAIVLLPPKLEEVQIKDENVNYAETLLGDDTGEIRLVGWRELANMLKDLQTGIRIKVYGVSANLGRDGSNELRLKPFSKIMKV